MNYSNNNYYIILTRLIKPVKTMLYLFPTFKSLQQVSVVYWIAFTVVNNSLNFYAFLLQKDTRKFSGTFVIRSCMHSFIS